MFWCLMLPDVPFQFLLNHLKNLTTLLSNHCMPIQKAVQKLRIAPIKSDVPLIRTNPFKYIRYKITAANITFLNAHTILISMSVSWYTVFAF